MTRRDPALLAVALLALLLGPACGEPPALVVSWDPAQVELQLPEVVGALRGGDPQRALAVLDGLAAAQALPEGAGHFRALALQDLGRAPEAEQEFVAEIELHPGNGRAHALLAQLLIDQGRLDEAGQHLEAARLHAPDFPIVQLLSGRLALQQDDDEHAQRAFSDYLLLDPFGAPAVEAYHSLSLIAARRGPAGAAQAEASEQASQALAQVHAFLGSYKARLQRNPDDVEAADGVARAYLNLYQTFAGDRRLLAMAEPALLHVLERQPDHATALYNLGFIRAEQQRLPEAIELFQRSVEADPEVAPARINLGRALLVTGQREQAIHELERALQVATTDNDRARAHLELAHAREAGATVDDWAAAVQHYIEVTKLYPDDNGQMQEQIDRLQQAIADSAAPPP